ncbi:MAG TPA: AbrB/MazE/SpoVT family DNA-binding domain-containing protein [Candidatus Binatia bacterium]|nr:AbrB/MazE/SpoVT family DNA-binding domain-containing protein [Candidatus Binatia bacterium]
MSKVTSKLQVTLPKVVAQQLGIRPGDQIDWEVTGETLRVIPAGKRRRRNSNVDVQTRLRLFDQATRRQQKRESMITPALLDTAKSGRGWTREDLYSRGDNRPEGSGEIRGSNDHEPGQSEK